MHVFMLSYMKHACFHVFSPFSAYFFPHDIIAEKGLLHTVTAIISFSVAAFSTRVSMEKWDWASLGRARKHVSNPCKSEH